MLCFMSLMALGLDRFALTFPVHLRVTAQRRVRRGYDIMVSFVIIKIGLRNPSKSVTFRGIYC